MLRKVVLTVLLPLACMASFSACTATAVSTNETNQPIDESKLSISETCALLDELGAQHNSQQERALADMAVMARNTQPMIEFLETTIVIFEEAANQTGDSSMRAALLTQINDYQMIKEVLESHSIDDPALATEMQKLKSQLDVDAMPYIESQCPGSIMNPDPDDQ